MSPSDQLASSAKILPFRHFAQLDGLRGVAILLVITGHVLEFGLGVTRGGALGGLGVMLFFVLSGFLITGLLDREILQTGSISLSRFYVRRALRLVPAFFCFLAVLSLLISLHLVRDTPSYTVMACLIYARNVWGRGSSTGHIWSLSMEEQFYLCWPWIMRAVTRKESLWTAWAGVATVSAFRMAAIHSKLFDYGAGIFYERPWFRSDSILIGCAVALWLRRSERAGDSNFSQLGLPFSVLLWPTTLGWTLWGEAVTHVWYLTVQMTLATLILLSLLTSKSPIYLSAFTHPVAAWLGRISYSWYLWQQLFTAFRLPAWHGLRTVPFNAVVSLLIASLSYRFVERPFLRMRNHLSQRKATISVTVADAG